MSLFGELKRRIVFRVGIAYVVASWILIQVADTLIFTLGLPDWASKLVLLFLLTGLALALVTVTQDRNTGKTISQIAAEPVLPALRESAKTVTQELGL